MSWPRGIIPGSGQSCGRGKRPFGLVQELCVGCVQPQKDEGVGYGALSTNAIEWCFRCGLASLFRTSQIGREAQHPRGAPVRPSLFEQVSSMSLSLLESLLWISEVRICRVREQFRSRSITFEKVVVQEGSELLVSRLYRNRCLVFSCECSLLLMNPQQELGTL